MTDHEWSLAMACVETQKLEEDDNDSDTPATGKIIMVLDNESKSLITKSWELDSELAEEMRWSDLEVVDTNTNSLFNLTREIISKGGVIDSEVLRAFAAPLFDPDPNIGQGLGQAFIQVIQCVHVPGTGIVIHRRARTGFLRDDEASRRAQSLIKMMTPTKDAQWPGFRALANLQGEQRKKNIVGFVEGMMATRQKQMDDMIHSATVSAEKAAATAPASSDATPQQAKMEAFINARLDEIEHKLDKRESLSCEDDDKDGKESDGGDDEETDNERDLALSHSLEAVADLTERLENLTDIHKKMTLKWQKDMAIMTAAEQEARLEHEAELRVVKMKVESHTHARASMEKAHKAKVSSLERALTNKNKHIQTLKTKHVQALEQMTRANDIAQSAFKQSAEEATVASQTDIKKAHALAVRKKDAQMAAALLECKRLNAKETAAKVKDMKNTHSAQLTQTVSELKDAHRLELESLSDSHSAHTADLQSVVESLEVLLAEAKQSLVTHQQETENAVEQAVSHCMQGFDAERQQLMSSLNQCQIQIEQQHQAIYNSNNHQFYHHQQQQQYQQPVYYYAPHQPETEVQQPSAKDAEIKSLHEYAAKLETSRNNMVKQLEDDKKKKSVPRSKKEDPIFQVTKKMGECVDKTIDTMFQTLKMFAPEVGHSVQIRVLE